MIGMKAKPNLKPGDPVIYRMTKHSQRPGPRAKSVSPCPNGDEYKYLVDKFWVVDQILDNGQLVLRTRRGKTRVIRQDDHNLRPPAWWEVLLYRNYFPQANAVADSTKAKNESACSNG